MYTEIEIFKKIASGIDKSFNVVRKQHLVMNVCISMAVVQGQLLTIHCTIQDIFLSDRVLILIYHSSMQFYAIMNTFFINIYELSFGYHLTSFTRHRSMEIYTFMLTVPCHIPRTH